MIYVDDFKLVGPKENLPKGWELITDAVDMGRQEALGLFLGCNHEKIEKHLSNGIVLRGVSYNMGSYARTQSPNARRW